MGDNPGGDAPAGGAADDAADTGDEKAPKAAKVGDAVRDGKFEFTVTKVKCGVDSVGNNEYTKQDAQGQFCLVDVTVKNIGDEPQTFNDFEQKAFDSKNREYEPDTEAGWAANPNTTDVWLKDINPGNQIKGTLVFDIPKDTKLTKIELHDSSLSNGIVVNL